MTKQESPGEEISCEVFVEFLSDYVEDELPKDRKATFENHLAGCVECDAYLDSYEKTIGLVKSAQSKNVIPEEAPQDLVDAILAATKTR